MAAGVGKTYRMLQEGRQAQNDGRDVMIGYLEPHDRPETALLADGLEQVPRRRYERGDLAIEDMDLDAVLARRPELALVDELAHTNAPGMRNAKRYEDIDEILEAGSDVISTVNIQHLESLNDTIAEMTGVRVRETFPDRILDEADEVVLVDITPEGLQQRIQAGKVYRPDRIETALSNFFRSDNLSGLRELALREVAEDVEERAARVGMLDDLSRRAVRERTLVLATPDPRSQRIVRRAWRSAQRLNADLDVLWVRRPGRELTDDEETALAALRRLVVILGGHFIEEEGGLVETVRRVADERGTTYVFLGTPDERRRTEILRGSLVTALIRELPGVDIRVVANRADRRVRP